MSKLLFAGTENCSPADERTQRSVPARRYSQLPATHSITSGAPVLKVRVAGRITPMDFFVPSASCRLWLPHWPSKYTLARVVTLTPEKVSVVMGASRWGESRILGERPARSSVESKGRVCAYPKEEARQSAMAHDLSDQAL